MPRVQEDAVVRANRNYRGDYFHLELAAPGVAPLVQPGQFAHVQIPDAAELLLRRPFSIFDADAAAGTIGIVYKVVGAGTRHLAALAPGRVVNVLGPLGKGFPPVPPERRPVIVAGGYGCAATYLVARRAAWPGVVLLGGRTTPDVLLDEAFAALGWEVRISTDDGSRGHRGLVTELLAAALAEPGAAPAVYACGPNAMLAAVARLCLARGLDAALSLDQHMGCGVGACFTCVVKLKADTPDGWEYVRTCRDGPVFMASQVVW